MSETRQDSDNLARELPPGSLAVERHTVSKLLYERLTENDIAEVERRAAGSKDTQPYVGHLADPHGRWPLVLALGMWLGVDGVAAKTALPTVQPPPDVHAMARGPLAAAGGLYEADLVIDALLSAGGRVEDLRRVLDFGCSSGRVIRVLAAAYPSVRWVGCDPNEKAIAWAGENLPGIDFFVNGQEPPLQLEDRSLDMALGVSIWSHFEPAFGLRWLDEMYRIIRPGGYLACTMHGYTSIAYNAQAKLRGAAQLQEVKEAMYHRGWWYRAEFGEIGDWGVVNPLWGNAFVSPEWVLAQICPRWRVAEFAPGRNQLNQDVYVLERV